MVLIGRGHHLGLGALKVVRMSANTVAQASTLLLLERRCYNDSP